MKLKSVESFLDITRGAFINHLEMQFVHLDHELNFHDL